MARRVGRRSHPRREAASIDRIVISDVIEYHVALIALLAYIGYVIYSVSRTAARKKKAGITRMSKLTNIVKLRRPAPPLTQQLAAKADGLRTDQAVEAGLVQHYALLSNQAAKASEDASHKASAIEQAKAILDKAGVTL